MVERALHHGLGGRLAEALQEVLLQRAGVDADPDRHLPLGRRLGDLAHPPGGADVPRVDPQAVHPPLQAGEGQSVVEVDVHDQRDPDPGADGLHGQGGVRVRDGHPHDLAARGLQRPDLVHRGLDVARVRLGHGLDADGGAPPHRHAAHVDLSRRPPGVAAPGRDGQGRRLGEGAEVDRLALRAVRRRHGYCPSHRKMSL